MKFGSALRYVLLMGASSLMLPGSLRAQTIINLTNLPATAPSGVSADTTLDLVNNGIAQSNGNIPSAVSALAQSATNSLNIAGMPSATPVVLGDGGSPTGAGSVSINMLAAAGYSQGGGSATTSLSIGNSNAAVAKGLNQIIGSAPQLGYGAQQGGAIASGSQSGINTLNAASVSVPDMAAVALSQMPAVVAATGGYVEPTAASLANTLPSVYGSGSPTGPFDSSLAANPVRPNLNLSVVNTLLGYSAAGPAVVGGGSAGAMAAQSAGNTFNSATIAGGQTLAAQQLADFPTSAPLASPTSPVPTTSVMQSVNTATAYNGQLGNANITGGAVSPADLTTVANLGQSASTTINTLNLAPAPGSGAGGQPASLTGVQSGSLPWVVSTNQAVASSGIGADANGNISNGILLSANGSANWAGFAAAQAAAGLPAPGSVPSAAALPAMATSSVANVAQSIGIGLNAVNVAGNLQLGATGFAQSSGSMTLANSVLNDATTGWTQPGTTTPYANFQPTPLNAGIAIGGAGFANVSSLTQSYLLGGNTVAASGSVGGTLTQSVGSVDYNAAGLVPAQSQSAIYPGLTPFSGAGAQQGASATPSYGPYIASLGAVGDGASLNGAVGQLTGPGKVTLTSVSQSAVGALNTLQAVGAVGSGASGTITQQVGTLADYGGTLNKQIALVSGAGNAVIQAPTQALALTVNGIAAGGAVSGSIVQTAPTTPGNLSAIQPSNAIVAASVSSGGASIIAGTGGGATQSNVQSLNVIASGSTIGSPGSVASIAQTAPAISYVVDGITPNPVNAIQASAWRANDPSGVIVNTQISGASQVASLGVNTLAAASGALGTITQASGGLSSNTVNVQSGLSGFCSTCQLSEAAPRYAVGSGNTQIVNAAQSNAQSLNTSSFGGTVNGTLNVALSGATSLTTSNLINGAANLGNTKVSGVQMVANAVSVVASGH